MDWLVRNVERDTILGDKVAVAQTWFARLKGLLGRAELAQGEGLHLVPCSSIHMFFMRFSIDVAFLDQQGRVVRAIHGIKPWRATRMYLDAHSALELPAGALQKSGTVEGDLLHFECGSLGKQA
ncbi:MAG: DUF192 domain-containing protein [Deltaproteobacteria bacterium]|nr:DUF192 domain-containing protein [Deltaproteobacteria bacterium]